VANIVMLNAIADTNFGFQTDKLILYFLASRCFNNAQFTPTKTFSMNEMAEVCCIKHRSTVFKAIRRLEESGWLKTNQNGRGLKNSYTISIPKSYSQPVAQNQHPLVAPEQHENEPVAQNQQGCCPESTGGVAQNQQEVLPRINTSYNYNNNSYKSPEEEEAALDLIFGKETNPKYDQKKPTELTKEPETIYSQDIKVYHANELYVPEGGYTPPTESRVDRLHRIHRERKERGEK